MDPHAKDKLSGVCGIVVTAADGGIGAGLAGGTTTGFVHDLGMGFCRTIAIPVRLQD